MNCSRAMEGAMTNETNKLPADAPYCWSCKAEISPTDRFCPHCGAKVSSASVGPSSSTIDQPQNPIVNDTGLALGVYILYFVGYFTGITAIIGVIIAHLQANSANPVLKSHYTFQKKTFWMGLLYLVAGCIFYLH